MQLNVVDLPAPLGPISPVSDPCSTSKEAPSTAVTPPKRLTSPRLGAAALRTGRALPPPRPRCRLPRVRRSTPRSHLLRQRRTRPECRYSSVSPRWGSERSTAAAVSIRSPSIPSGRRCMMNTKISPRKTNWSGAMLSVAYARNAVGSSVTIASANDEGVSASMTSLSDDPTRRGPQRAPSRRRCPEDGAGVRAGPADDDGDEDVEGEHGHELRRRRDVTLTAEPEDPGEPHQRAADNEHLDLDQVHVLPERGGDARRLRGSP